MEVNEIQKFLNARPFKPFELHLDNGQKQLITHPEVIATDTLIIAVDVNGEIVVIAPEAVSALRFPKNQNENSD